MTRLLARTRHKLTHTISRRLPERYRRDDSGLTTLEWLLIVAAVAGLAALAVVLVTNVVGDTSEQISGQNARVTAVRVAAQSIVDRHVAGELDDDDAEERCERLPIVYSDLDGLTATWDSGADTCTLAGLPT